MPHQISCGKHFFLLLDLEFSTFLESVHSGASERVLTTAESFLHFFEMDNYHGFFGLGRFLAWAPN
jgi:hypothetical protein